MLSTALLCIKFKNLPELSLVLEIFIFRSQSQGYRYSQIKALLRSAIYATKSASY